ncbi:MAG: hypothetical protein ACJ0KI_07735 [Dehalococcoidia bacterium]|tara:strand:- start:634 stop:924 length:291 start_codon:yes stop_codon:yes gene_type:complete
MLDTISVLNPSAKPRRLQNQLSNRSENLEGKRLGFLWNNKPNGNVIFQTLENVLVSKLSLSSVAYYSKWTASIPVDEDTLQCMGAEVDLAIVGLAD